MSMNEVRTKEAVNQIVQWITQIEADWKDAYGWAPTAGADLLNRSRLDRVVSLARCLSIWLEPAAPEEMEGRLVLAWANLGALLEGMMKTFLSIYHHDYSIKPVTRGQKTGKPLEPDELQLESLRQFFAVNVWTPRQKKRWGAFVEMIQLRRNAIHAFKNRDIGTFNDFQKAVVKFRIFIYDTLNSLPEPPPRNGEGYC